MKGLILFLSIIGLAHLKSYGQKQNLVPEILNVSVSTDPSSKRIVVKYDLFDTENDSIKVTLKASYDAGESYLVNTSVASGDIGFPVMPGKSKVITWDYPHYITDIDRYELKIIADDLRTVQVEDLLAQVDTSNLRRIVSTLEGVRNSSTDIGRQNLESARKFIGDWMRRANLNVAEQPLGNEAGNGQNIIAKMRGQHDEVHMLLLGAHFDTVEGSEGADDNASGVAAMLEAARILSKYNFNRSIGFVAFDKEESGLEGSTRYVQGIPYNERIHGFINFDMIGYYSDEHNSQHVPKGFDKLFPEATGRIASRQFKGDFALILSNANSRMLLDAFMKANADHEPDLPVITLVAEDNGRSVPSLRASDHAPFWDANIMSIHVGDASFTRNKNYHMPGDTSDKLNFGKMADVVRITLATLCQLAQPQHSAYVIAKIQTPASRK